MEDGKWSLRRRCVDSYCHYRGIVKCKRWESVVRTWRYEIRKWEDGHHPKNRDRYLYP